MHSLCENFVKRHLKPLPTLDVGSKRHRRQWTPKSLLPRYIGLDFLPGENVDVIADCHRMPFRDSSFPQVICLNTLEHDADPAMTLREIVRVLAEGGRLVLSAAGPGYAPHEVEQCGGHYKNIELEELRAWAAGLQIEHLALVSRGGPQDIQLVAEAL